MEDVGGVQGDVLHAGSTKVFDEFLDLGFAKTGGGFVDRHFDGLVVVGDDDGFQGGVFGVELFVIDGPESMEGEGFDVPVYDWFHLMGRDVYYAVVDVVQVGGGEGGGEGVGEIGVCGVVGREEGEGVGVALDEGVVRLGVPW